MTVKARRHGYDLRQLTIGQVLADKARKNGDRIYLTYAPDGRTYSYADIDRLSNVMANGLLALGIGHGTHVAVTMENCPELFLLYLALGKVGAVGVPVNTGARGTLLHYFLDHSDSTVLIASADLAERFVEIQDRLPKMKRVIALTGDGTLPAGLAVPVTDFRALEAGPAAPPDVPVKYSDPAFICYTSGTTGPSKGVLLTQARLLLGSISQLETYGHRLTDVIYVCLPLFHTNALQGSFYIALMADASVVLAKRFSASRFWAEMRETGATVVNLLGSMLNIVWGQAPGSDDAAHRVRMCLAAPVPKFALEFERRFATRLVAGYGLTDYGSGISFTLNDPVAKLGSLGRPRAGWEVRIVDEDDLDMPVGETGEIVCRCNNPWETSSGYYKMAEATVASMRNNWFHTGDRGYRDEDGYFHFVDRKKDSIRRRGENVSSYEVEQAILAHVAVADAAVFPVTSEMSEDEVAAAVVLKAGAALAEADLIAHCARNLAYFMVPRFLRFMPDMPRTLSQKVEKYKLRQDAETNPAVWWDREKAGIVLSC